MGLKMNLYWIVQYVWFYFLYCCVIAFLVIGGYVLGRCRTFFFSCSYVFLSTTLEFRFFTVNSPILYILLFVFWGHTLIAMSFLLSVFFSKSRTAISKSFCFLTMGSVVTNEFFSNSCRLLSSISTLFHWLLLHRLAGIQY